MYASPARRTMATRAVLVRRHGECCAARSIHCKLGGAIARRERGEALVAARMSRQLKLRGRIQQVVFVGLGGYRQPLTCQRGGGPSRW